MSPHEVIPVHESSQTIVARSEARRHAERAGFDETDAHRAGLVATELSTNLVKHTSGGQMLISASAEGLVEIMTLDSGPGMTDVARSLTDGHSTTGTSGTGLGAIRRLSDEFDLYSAPAHGTIVWSRLWRGRKRPPPRGAFEVAGICVSKSGETVCGDSWTLAHRPDEVTAAIIDGLGHGLHAAEASRAAVDAFHSRPFSSCSDVVRAMHERLRHTRGAAGTVVTISRAKQTVQMAGIGNVVAAICAGDTVRRAVSLSGILGGDPRPVREYSYPWTHDAILVMHSDGLTTSWSLSPYSGLQRRHPSVIAAVLYRDFTRGRDDVTVVVGREAA